MIVVRIELHSATSGKITEIGRMHISNDGTLSNTSSKGNYKIDLLRRGSKVRILKRGSVLNHLRKSKSIWALVSKALKAVGF